MADTPIDALADWQNNEVISTDKLNAMNAGIRYAGKTASSANDNATEAKATADQASQSASKANTNATNAVSTANTANTSASQALNQARDALSKINEAISGTGYITKSQLDSLLDNLNTEINTTRDNLNNRWVSITNFTQISADKLSSTVAYYIADNDTSVTPQGHAGCGVIYPKTAGSWANARIVFFDSTDNRMYINLSGTNSSSYQPTGWTEIMTNNSPDFTNLKNSALSLKTVNNVDLNTLSASGVYYVNNISGNGPTGVNTASVITIASDSTHLYGTQLLVDVLTGIAYVRIQNNSNWSLWSQLIDTNYLATSNLDNSIKIKDLGTIKDLNNANVAGEYVGMSDGLANLPTDPDTGTPIANTSITVNVITNDTHTNGSQEVVQNAKGYKYLRGLNNGVWSSWSVLTPFS